MAADVAAALDASTPNFEALLAALMDVTNTTRSAAEALFERCKAHPEQLVAALVRCLRTSAREELRELSAVLQGAAAAAAGAQRAAREAERYWVTVFFGAQPPGTLYAGTVLRWLRDDAGLVSFLFEGLGLELPVKVVRDVRPGDSLVVECTAARPREGALFFREKAPGAPGVLYGGYGG